MKLDQKTIAALAEHLESAELQAHDVVKITDEHPDMDWDDAYAIQAEILRRKLARGDKLVGLKCGLTSRAKMAGAVNTLTWNDGQWHTYTMQWGPGFLRAYQDGILVATVNSGIPDKPMHPVLQNEFSNTISDPAKPDPSLNGHVYVDRITYDRSYTIPPSDF